MHPAKVLSRYDFAAFLAKHRRNRGSLLAVGSSFHKTLVGLTIRCTNGIAEYEDFVNQDDWYRKR